MNEREREIEAIYTRIDGLRGTAAETLYQEYADMLTLADYVRELEAALTPFAAVGAQVAARPAYPPTQEIMRVGAASFTVADLIAASSVVGMTAEAVTGGRVGTGISEIMEDAK